MALSRFRPLRTSDAELLAIQKSLQEALDPLSSNQFLDSILLDEVALTTSFQNIPHKLGRKYVGWVVVGKDADARVWNDTAANTEAESFVRLRASASVNVRLYVF